METETSQDNLLSKPPSSKTPPRWRGLFLRGLLGENRGRSPRCSPPHEGVLAHPRHSVLVDGGLLADHRGAAAPGAAGRLAPGAGPGLPVRGSERRDGPQFQPLDLSLGAPAALAGASVLVCPALHAPARGLRS